MKLKSSQALGLLKAISLQQVRSVMPDLTTRQLTILLIVYLETPPHTVRGLAVRLAVTKPVITRALDTMGAMKLVHRRRDESDKRNVVIIRTLEGAQYVDDLASLIIDKAMELPA